MMQIRTLGDVTVTNDGVEVAIGGPRPRRLLAALVLDAPGFVSVDRLAEAMWPDPDGRPQHPDDTIRTYVARLRRVLGDDAIATGDGAYALSVDSDTIDARRFERLLAAGRSSTDSDEQLDYLERAHELWHGAPYGSFGSEPAFAVDQLRLHELRIQSEEDRLRALIRSGNARQAVAPLEALVASEPLRDEPHRLLMLALHREGRQAEALRVANEARRVFADEVGLDVSDELIELERRIATRDPSLFDDRPSVPSLRGFEVWEEVGAGSFGRVFRAEQPGLRREVAIKTIRKELADDPEFIRRFEAEAQVIGRLEHPHIVPLYDYWRDPSGAYLVMRYLAGGTLADRFASGLGGPELTKRWVQQIGDALEAAHRQGVVHRDLRPANIFFDLEDRAFLGDFGIAALEGLEQPSRRSSAGYAPPEVGHGEVEDRRSDVYGLALLASESLLGRALTSPTEPRGLDPAALATADLPLVVRRALSPDRRERPDSVAEFVADFDDNRPARTVGFAGNPPNRSDARNPYRGLHAFDEPDAGVFFGREDLIGSIVAHLDEHRFVAVVGPSGSGKSSVVRAGVIAHVRQDTDDFIVTMTPGSDPFSELDVALRRIAVDPPSLPIRHSISHGATFDGAIRQFLPADADLVLVIDQFEEFYTLTDSDEDRTLFIDGLVAAVQNSSSGIRAVVTLRADFFDRPLRHDTLGDLVVEHQVVTLPLRSSELERAISGPAGQVGVAVEPALIAAMVEDTSGAAQALPMLQYTLTELFDRRPTDTLTLDGYRELGGVWGAIAARAEAVYGGLDMQAADAARVIFTDLVALGEGTEDTRRRAPRSLFDEVPGASLVLDRYGAVRLLTFDHDPATRAPTVEVAHEALIREWPRFREWVDEDRERLRLGRRIGDAADQWQLGGRADGDLLRSGRLEAAAGWLDDPGREVAPITREFVLESAARERAEIEREQRATRRLRRLVTAVGVVAVFALVAMVFAVIQQRRARDEAAAATEARAQAETRRMGADAAQLVSSNRRLGLLLAAEAYRRDPGVDTLGALHVVLTSSEGFRTYLGGDEEFERLSWLDGDRVLAATPSELRIYSAGSGELLQASPSVGVRLLSHHPESGRLAIVGTNQVRVVEADLDLVASPIATDSRVESIAFVDRDTIVTGHADGSVRVQGVTSDGPSLVIDAHPERSLEELGLEGVSPGNPHQPETFQIGAHAVAVSADGSRLATGSLARVRVWRLGDGALLHELDATFGASSGDRVASSVADLEFDDLELLVATSFNVARFSIDGDRLAEALLPNRASATTTDANTDIDVDLIPGGVVLARSGGTIEVLSVEAGTLDPSIEVNSQLPGTPEVARSPNGAFIATAGNAGLAIMPTDGSTPISRTVYVGDRSEVNLTADGRYLMASSPDPSGALIWDLDQPDALAVDLVRDRSAQFLFPSNEGFLAVDFVADNRAEADPIVVFDGDRRERFSLENPEGILSQATTLEGDLIATADDLPVYVFDGDDGSLLAELPDLSAIGENGFVRSLGFSPDGRRVVAATTEGAAMWWDTATWQPTVFASGGGSVLQAKYSHDGRWLVTIDDRGIISLRDPETAQPIRQLAGNTDAVSGFSHGPFFTEDGRFMVSTADRNGRLWDLATGTQIGRAIPSRPGSSPNASADGNWLATVDTDGMASVWNLRVEDWYAIACRAAGRNMTLAEWEQVGPANEPYQPTCAQWPDLGAGSQPSKEQTGATT